MRFATYNIRHAQGIDGFILPRRIARVLGGTEASVVGLQEVWNIPRRQDQTRRIADQLEMQGHFALAERRGPLELGNAVLTEHEIISTHTLALPHRYEGRNCLVTELMCEGLRFRFAVTHLPLHGATRTKALRTLADELPRDLPLVLVGDFNAEAHELDPLREFLQVPHEPPATFPAPRPRSHLDHIAFSSHWELERLETVPSWASDHLPLFADLEPVAF